MIFLLLASLAVIGLTLTIDQLMVMFFVERDEVIRSEPHNRARAQAEFEAVVKQEDEYFRQLQRKAGQIR